MITIIIIYLCFTLITLICIEQSATNAGFIQRIIMSFLWPLFWIFTALVHYYYNQMKG